MDISYNYFKFHHNSLIYDFRLTQETEVNGYILPQDCVVVSNIKHFMRNPNLWEKPKQFNPSRFINENGELSKPEYFVPLGHGRRICLGESLVKE